MPLEIAKGFINGLFICVWTVLVPFFIWICLVGLLFFAFCIWH